MLTNYKINQPFTSDCSVEKGEKNSSRTWNHGAGRIFNHVETFFYAEARKVSGRKTIESQHCESQFVPGWTEFFLVPFKESRFPLFGISIQAGKRSSRSITERSCATGKLKTTTSRLKYFISSEKAAKNQSTFKRYRFYTFCVSQMWILRLKHISF